MGIANALSVIMKLKWVCEIKYWKEYSEIAKINVKLQQHSGVFAQLEFGRGRVFEHITRQFEKDNTGKTRIANNRESVTCQQRTKVYVNYCQEIVKVVLGCHHYFISLW